MHTQEAKKKRRRESHNLVERRRRDNINERIQDLSKLVPTHRLEDEKVRNHLTQKAPLSPHGFSPPQATSLLAGGSGRRAAPGTITQGLPQDEKEKGPNKGDILNSAVSWMRDSNWLMTKLLRDREMLIATLQQHGLPIPVDESDNERRMLSELKGVRERTECDAFRYSRAHGTGLRVPEFTTLAGDPLDPNSVANETMVKNEDDESGFWDDDQNFVKEEEEMNMDLQ